MRRTKQAQLLCSLGRAGCESVNGVALSRALTPPTFD